MQLETSSGLNEKIRVILQSWNLHLAVIKIALQIAYVKYHNIKFSIDKITRIFTFVVSEWI